MAKRKKKNYVGSIYTQNNNNILFIKYRGKRIRTGWVDNTTNRKKAVKLLQELEKEYQAKKTLGILEKKGKILDFNTLFNEFIDYKSKTLQATSIRLYKYAYNQLFKNIGKIKVDNLKKEVFSRANSLIVSNRFKNKSTFNVIFRNTQVFLNYLYDMQYIDAPVYLFKKYRFKLSRKNVQPLTIEELHCLLSYIDDKEFKNLIKFQVFTGFRIKETIELTFDRIDFKNKLISLPNKINKGVTDTVHILDNALELLYEQYDIASDRKGDRNKVFRWEGSHKSIVALTTQLNHYMDKAGIKIKGQAFHRLRNTFSSILIQSKISPFKIRDYMRHSDFDVFLKHYYHTQMDDEDEKINNYMKELFNNKKEEL